MNGSEPQAARDMKGIAARDALDALRWHWGDAYEIGHDDEHGWRARRRDGLGEDLAAADPDEMYGVIGADYNAKPVPRDITQADSS